MTDLAAREEQLIREIEKEMDKLDQTLAKMDETDSKIKHFIEQEKALHEIRTIIRKEHKLEKLEEKDAQHEIDAVVNELEREESLINGINKEVEKLDKTLSKIDGDENRVKSYFEQKKALHEIREIVKKVNKL